MAGQNIGVERADHRHLADRLDKRQMHGLKARGPRERRGAAALLKQGLRHQHRDPRRDEIERHARDQLIASEGDRGQPVHGRKDQRPDDTRQEPDPDRAGQRRNGRRGHGGHQHLALKPDVENPRTFGIEAGQTGQQQGGSKAQRRVEDLQDGRVIHHIPP